MTSVRAASAAVAFAVAWAAGCAATGEPSRDDWVQALAEARARAASLERTVERLERELAESRASAPSAPPAPSSTRQPCAAATAGGTRCKRAARAGERFCWQHAPESRGADAPADSAAPQ